MLIKPNYEKTIKRVCESCFGGFVSVRRLNQGYYGFVFLVEKRRPPKYVIAKVYKNEGFMSLEHKQLDLLRKYALTKVPEIYAESTKSENGAFDIMFMEYICGVNGSQVKISSERERDILCNQVVDNLLSIHSVKNSRGFGELDSKCYVPSWNDYYKNIVKLRTQELHDKAGFFFPKEILKTADIFLDGFERVFSSDKSESSLIHGDYNMWNLMVDPDTNRLIGMIDPMGCSYADSELDLFQLQNANGNDLGLLDCYIKKAGASENIHIKNGYYRFFDDVKHWLLSGNLDKPNTMNYVKKTLEFLK